MLFHQADLESIPQRRGIPLESSNGRGVLPYCRFQTGYRGLSGSDSGRELSLSESRLGPRLEYLVKNLELLLEPFVFATHIGTRKRPGFEVFKAVPHRHAAI
jgi:hypothetical protein